MTFTPQLDAAEQALPDQLTLRDLWEILLRRRSAIYTSTAVVFVIAVLLGITTTRTYTSTGEIQIQKDSMDALGLDSMMGAGAAAVSDALDANVTLQTEAKIMESQTLALTVIDRLHIDSAPDFKPHFSLLGWFLGMIAPAGPKDGPVKPGTLSPKKRERLYLTFKANTKVAPVAGTRLIDISYKSQDPKMAADVVNAMIVGLVDYNYQTRYNATSQTSEWLSKQLSELRTSSDDLQKQVAALQRESGVFSFGQETTGGIGSAYSTVLDQLRQSTASLSQAESNRIVLGAIREAALAGHPESMASLVASGSTGGGSASLGQSLSLLQGLRAQEASQRALISETSAKFGSAYPRLEEMQANLASVQESIGHELQRLQKQADNDYHLAEKVEASSRKVFEEQRKSAEAVNDKAIQYELLRQEADQSRELYSKLQSKLEEAGVLEGLRSSNITVVEPGRVASKPSSPNMLLLLLLVVMGGPIVGIGAAFAREILDSSVGEATALAARYGSAFLGALPLQYEEPRRPLQDLVSLPRKLFRRADVLVPRQLSAGYVESLRSVRTVLALARPPRSSTVILVTSAREQEGKSSVARNLARQLAFQGKSVALIDADMRSHGISTYLGGEDSNGLSDVLAGTLNAEDAMLQDAGTPGLMLLPSGTRPDNPAELLASDQMGQLLTQLRSHFDTVVIDSAPVLLVTDPVLLAAKADQVVFVARYSKTKKADFERGLRLLSMRVPQTPAAILLNGVPPLRSTYYSVPVREQAAC